jgi:outer membrane protein assembly factor BamB
VIIATRNGRVSNHDPATGEERWTIPTQAIRDSGPAIDGDRLYVAEISRRGLLHAVDLETGSRLWSKVVGATSSSPVAAEGLVVIMSDKAGGPIAFDRENGDQRWNTQIPGWLGSLAFSEGRLLLATDRGVIALSAEDGHRLWFRELGGPTRSPAILGVVAAVASEDGRLTLLDVETGEPRWSREGLGSPVGLPTIHRARVYLVCGERLIAFDARDGREIWSSQAAPGTSPTVADETIYLLMTPDRIAALDASEGALLWSRPLERSLGALPTVAHGALILPMRVDLEGTAYLLALE